MLRVDTATGEIFIYDLIGQNWFGDGILSIHVIEALAAIGNKRAKIRINSPGGSMDEGVAIYSAIKRHPAGADTYNDSLAASAGSMIFLAGENRFISKGARVMIHRAWGGTAGNALEFQKYSQILELHDASQCEIYCEYLGMGKDEVMNLLTAETWYTSEEAITAKIATAMDSKKADKPKASLAATWFKNPPKDFAAAMKQDETERLISNRCDRDIAVARRKLIGK